MSETASTAPAPKKRKGFAAMTAEQRRIIASKGGRAAHKKGTAHEWTRVEARIAGQRGGQISRGGRGKLQVFHETNGEQPGQVKDVA